MKKLSQKQSRLNVAYMLLTMVMVIILSLLIWTHQLPTIVTILIDTIIILGLYQYALIYSYRPASGWLGVVIVSLGASVLITLMLAPWHQMMILPLILAAAVALKAANAKSHLP